MDETPNLNRKIDRRALLAILLTSVMGWIFAFLAFNYFMDYALGLFIWLPLVLGATSTLIYGLNNISDRGKLFDISMWTFGIFCLGLLAFAWEGIICMLMSAPIGLFFNWLGHYIGYHIIKRKWGIHRPLLFCCFCLFRL